MRHLYGDQFARQHPVYPLPQIMLSPENILKLPSGSSNPPFHLIEVWPASAWTENTAIFTTKSSAAAKVVGLFRFWSPALETGVDFAIGLKKRWRGRWEVWHLQRPSFGKLAQNVASVNEHLDQNLQRGRPWPRSRSRREDQWGETAFDSRLVVRIEETVFHSRMYYLIKANLAVESGQIHGFPYTATKTRKRRFALTPGPDDQDRILESTRELRTDLWVGYQSHTEWDIRIEDLMGEITISNSLEYYLGAERNDMMWEPLSNRIRIGWARAPAEEIWAFDVWGSSPPETALLQACKDGDDDIVEQMLWGSADLNLECTTLKHDADKHLRIRLDFEGFRPIHWAAMGGHCDVLSMLVTRGANMHARTSMGWSAFHLTALFGHTLSVRELIRVGLQRHQAHLNELVRNDEHNPLLESPMHLMFSHAVRLLSQEASALTHFMDVLGWLQFRVSTNHNGETLLHRVAASGLSTSWEEGSTMITYMSDPRVSQTPADHLGRTVLWHAVCGGDIKIVQCLVKSDPESLLVPDSRGMTPLHAACRLGHAQIAKTLLEAGADPDAVTSPPGLAPAHYAALYNHYECLMELEKFGTAIHKPTSSEDMSFRPIHLAAANRHLTSFEVLRDAGSDMNWTCTHYIILGSQDSKQERWIDRLEVVERFATVSELARCLRGDEADAFELPAVEDPVWSILEGASMS
ncbi:ankyrin repeat-containing domain protein [Xylariaceae sp. FL1272]|nr:ankyrin repeat-containing domain protein [Xylariaceae sp. FL1272]